MKVVLGIMMKNVRNASFYQYVMENVHGIISGIYTIKESTNCVNVHKKHQVC